VTPVPPIDGLVDVPITIPLPVIVAPPSLVTFPPDEELVQVVLETEVVVTVGGFALFIIVSEVVPLLLQVELFPPPDVPLDTLIVPLVILLPVKLTVAPLPPHE
jgi:hypothetical protein